MNIGLAASRASRQGARSQLARLLKRHAPFLRTASVFAVGGTWDAIRRARVLGSHPSLHRLPRGFEGGLMRMVALVVEPEPALALDLVVYLIDPNDPTSVYPEAQALKRQCVVHGKPFISTFAGADEWLTLCAGRYTGGVAHDINDPLQDAELRGAPWQRRGLKSKKAAAMSLPILATRMRRSDG